MTTELVISADTPEHAELRRDVRQLCDQFGEEYWQQRDLNREYPEQFVATLTKAGYLSALIPTEYGGLGLGITEAAVILEEVNRSGGHAAACHAQSRNRQRQSAFTGLFDHRTTSGPEHARHHELRSQRRRPLRRHRSQELDKPYRAIRFADAVGPHRKTSR